MQSILEALTRIQWSFYYGCIIGFINTGSLCIERIRIRTTYSGVFLLDIP